MKHLIFFDSSCPLCQNSVDRLIELDTKKIFIFSPLQGKTAQAELPEKVRHQNSIVLYEFRVRIWLRAQAVFRIFWLLGGKWKWIGWLWVLPGLNLFYRLVARYRHAFFKTAHPIKRDPDRFLP